MAIDGSKFSRTAVEFVASRSSLIGVDPDVLLLNVQPPVPVYVVSSAGRKAVSKYHQDEAEIVLKPALSRLQDAGLNVSERYAVGQPAEQISVVAAKSKADLIVIGSHGHSGLRRLLFGTRPKVVVEHSPGVAGRNRAGRA